MSASVGKDTEVHSVKRKCLIVKSHLTFVWMVVHVWRMELSEATIAHASQGMKETTALQPEKPARQMLACANMEVSVSGGIAPTLVFVLVSTQDNSAS